MSSPEANLPDDFHAAPASEGMLQRVAWRRKELLFLGCVVGIVAGAIYYSQQPPVYQSSAEIVVEKEHTAEVVTGAVQPWDDPVATQVEVLKSPAVMEIAARLLAGTRVTTWNDTTYVGKIVEEKSDRILLRLADGAIETVARADIRETSNPLERFASANEEELAARIKSGFSAVRQTKDGIYNRVLYLSFRGSDPDDCQLMLAAVIQGYDLFLRGRHQKVNDKTVGEVTHAIENLKKSMEEKKKAYDQHLLKKPLMASGDEGQLANVQSQRAVERRRRQMLAKQVEDLEGAIKAGKGQEMYRLIRGRDFRLPAGGGDVKLADMIQDSTVKLHLLLTDVGPDHPDVRSLRNKIKILEDFSRGKPLDAGPDRKTTPGEDPVRAYLAVLKHELQEQDLNLEQLDGQIREMEARVKGQADFRATEEHLRSERDQDKQRFESIINRLEDLKLSKNLGGLKIDVIAPATAGYKVGPVPLKIFMASLVLGLLLGAGLAFAAELMDRGFHTVEEVRDRLGLPVIGHIPIVDEKLPPPPAGSPLEPILCTYFQPKSAQAESFRGIRTWMYFTARGEHYKVIQITSPQARDGKTTLAANLAVSMAQSGKKVVLLDADFRKPRVHQIFGVSSTVGLASVIAGTASLKDAVLPTAVAGMWVMPCGPRPENPAELLSSPAFQHLLDALRKDFDFVLVDTPPLLAVSDPSAVAARVDGVLLVVRFSKYARPNARRAKDLLTSLQANVLGVVVNGYGRQGSPFGYDGYQGYGYGYGESGYHHDENMPAAQTAVHGARTPTSRSAPGNHGGFFHRLFGWWRSSV
jgi:succinoglycan biosynthesis transport protein ExoP